MRRRSLVLALALTVSGLAGAPLANAASTNVAVDPADGLAIPGSYIVTVRDGADARTVAATVNVTPNLVYTSALNGFAGKLNVAQVTALQHHPDVVAIEEDQLASTATTYNTNHSGWDTWGLDRIDQRNLPLSGTFTVTATGATVNAYIFDTGIRYSHLLFSGRAVAAYDAFGGNGSDCNGHGTHVAGTVGGLVGSTITGVAGLVSLRSVRVLDCSGFGSVSGIIGAIDWVRVNHVKPAVANMSLGLNGVSSSLDTAVRNLINAGVFTAVAAGNSSQSACNFSPSRVTEALVVAASDRTDTRANFSNHGSCVDLYAPGVAIWSAWHTGDDVVAAVDGTSQASPHAAGVGVLYKATFGDASSATVHNYIVNNATNGVIQRNRTGTVNKLLYSNLL